ncbi:unnamed protein product [Rodentolepis nana]|uniref:Uncharacterized protein n=1 Tax=Rodentolepis nana TaxID=102285 RepID=A0A0R3TMB0_RODNA|nr:unnamed protein product [Rodentolepis nana]
MLGDQNALIDFGCDASQSHDNDKRTSALNPTAKLQRLVCGMGIDTLLEARPIHHFTGLQIEECCTNWRESIFVSQIETVEEGGVKDCEAKRPMLSSANRQKMGNCTTASTSTIYQVCLETKSKPIRLLPQFSTIFMVEVLTSYAMRCSRRARLQIEI